MPSGEPRAKQNKVQKTQQIRRQTQSREKEKITKQDRTERSLLGAFLSLVASDKDFIILKFKYNKNILRLIRGFFILLLAFVFQN